LEFRASVSFEPKTFGTAACAISGPDGVGGGFYLVHRPEGAEITGVIGKSKDGVSTSYELHRSVDATTDWPELLQFAREVISHDLKFPDPLLNRVRKIRL